MKRKRIEYPLGGVSKMPGASWGISASKCIVGAKLALVPGSVCNICYCLGKGNYSYPAVINAHAKRLLDYESNPSKWINDIAAAIIREFSKSGENRFRWFDSGDLQSLEMLRAIVEVAKLTPLIRYWLPTKEYAIVKAFLASSVFPDNLNVRLSAYLIDKPAPKLFGLTGSATVTDKKDSNCQAYKGDTVNCSACDLCWRKDVAEVYYPKH